MKIALVTATPPTLFSVASFVSSLLNRRKIINVHLGMNSRMDELLRQKGISSHAEGRAEAEAEAEQKAKDAR
jgi:hypothetical protein